MWQFECGLFSDWTNLRVMKALTNMSVLYKNNVVKFLHCNETNIWFYSETSINGLSVEYQALSLEE